MSHVLFTIEKEEEEGIKEGGSSLARIALLCSALLCSALRRIDPNPRSTSNASISQVFIRMYQSHLVSIVSYPSAAKHTAWSISIEQTVEEKKMCMGCEEGR